MKLAIVGATGMVGNVMLDVIKERNLHFDELLLVASENSIGKIITYCGKEYSVIGLDQALQKKPEIAIFSAGGETSLLWAPKFAEVGTVVIDNSSAWRMDPLKKLIIPEINGSQIKETDKIIANPNCSTIQMLMVLAPIHKEYGVKRVIVSTYQSITGTGVKALKQLENEYKNIEGEMAYNYKIHQNAIPHCDDFLENGYTKEEMKLTWETHKILDPNIFVQATCVRVPVFNGHSEAVFCKISKNTSRDQVIKLLKNSEGIQVLDNPEKLEYPTPVEHANDTENVFVGRIRAQEHAEQNWLSLWIVADNVYGKGAALNAVQIAERLLATNKFQ